MCVKLRTMVPVAVLVPVLPLFPCISCCSGTFGWSFAWAPLPLPIAWWPNACRPAPHPAGGRSKRWCFCDEPFAGLRSPAKQTHTPAKTNDSAAVEETKRSEMKAKQTIIGLSEKSFRPGQLVWRTRLFPSALSYGCFLRHSDGLWPCEQPAWRPHSFPFQASLWARTHPWASASHTESSLGTHSDSTHWEYFSQKSHTSTILPSTSTTCAFTQHFAQNSTSDQSFYQGFKVLGSAVKNPTDVFIVRPSFLFQVVVSYKTDEGSAEGDASSSPSKDKNLDLPAEQAREEAWSCFCTELCTEKDCWLSCLLVNQKFLLVDRKRYFRSLASINSFWESTMPVRTMDDIRRERESQGRVPGSTATPNPWAGGRSCKRAFLRWTSC